MSWKGEWRRVCEYVGTESSERLEDRRMTLMRKLGSEKAEDVAEYIMFLVSGGSVVLPMPKEAEWPKM